jgi:predicted MFS family arabinose efflux permease
MKKRSVNDFSSIAVAAVVSGIGVVFFNVIPVFVGLLVDHLGLSSSRVATLASFYLAGYTLATIALIFTVRRFNWRWGVVLFAALQVSGFILAGLASTYFVLAGLLFLAGIGAGGLFGIALTSQGDGEHPDRNYGLGTFIQTLLPAGMAIVLTAAVIPAWGVFGAFFAISVPAMFCIVLVAWFPVSGRNEAESGSSGEPIGAAAWLGLTGALVFVVGMAALWTFFERIGNAAGISPSVTGFVISASLVAGGLGSLVPVILSDRWGRTWPILGSGLLLIAAIVLFTKASNPALYGAAGLLFFFSWTVSIIYQLGRLAARDQSGRVVAMLPALLGIASTLGPLSAAWLDTENNFKPLYIFTIASMLFSMFVVFVNRRREP